jgi:hypothetical protein
MDAAVRDRDLTVSLSTTGMFCGANTRGTSKRRSSARSWVRCIREGGPDTGAVGILFGTVARTPPNSQPTPTCLRCEQDAVSGGDVEREAIGTRTHTRATYPLCLQRTPSDVFRVVHFVTPSLSSAMKTGPASARTEFRVCSRAEERNERRSPADSVLFFLTDLP